VAVGVRVSERALTQPTLAAVLDLRSRLAQQLLAWDLRSNDRQARAAVVAWRA
jgi:hypothetical protein